MPNWTFHCNECGHDFDSLMKPHDPVECPACLARISNAYEGGKIIKTMAVTSPHQYRCSTEGAEPKGKGK